MIKNDFKTKKWLHIILNIMLFFGIAYFVAVVSLYALNMIVANSAPHLIAIPVALVVIPLLPFLLRKQLKKWLRKAYLPLKIFLTLCFMFFAVTFSWFYSYVVGYSANTVEAITQSNEGEKLAVLVFGCRVYEHGPSNMLEIRLLKAKELLDKNPDAIAIMSGGQGVDEHAPEAQVMKEYLVARGGIAEERIWTEENSHSTLQNIINSAELIERENLESYRLIGVSSDFHIPRIELFAKHFKMNITMVPSESYVQWSMIGNILREYLAVSKAIIFDLH